jgi:WD40 repeat protein
LAGGSPTADARADPPPAGPTPPLPSAAIPAVAAPLGALRLEPAGALGEGRFRHAGTVTHILPLADGRRLLTSARDGTARLWDRATGREIRRFYHPEGEDVWSVALLPGEREILTCGESKSVIRWDIATGKRRGAYQHEADVFRLAVRPGAGQFVAADRKKSAVVWFWATGQRAFSLRAHKESVYGAAVSPDERTLATCGDDSFIVLWDLTTGERRGRLAGHGDDVYTVAFSPDGQTILSCSEDKTARLWRLADGQLLWSVAFGGDTTVGAWAPDGKLVAVTSQDKHVHLIEATTGTTVRKLPVPGTSVPWPVAFSLNGREVIAAAGPNVYRFAAATGEPLFDPADPAAMLGPVDALDVSPDGAFVFAAGSDQLHVWDARAARPIARWPLPADALSLEASPDGRRLLVAADGKALVIDAATGRTLADLRDDQMAGANWLGDPAAVVTYSKGFGRDRDDLVVWNAASGKRVASISNGYRLAHLAVSRDGERIVTAPEEGPLRIWSRRTRSLLKELALGETGCSHCAVCADDRSIVAVGRDNRLYHWAAPPQDPARRLSATDLDRLLRQLGAEDFGLREEAVCELIRAGDQVLGSLVRVESGDLEVAHRVEQIRRVLEQARLPERLMGRPLVLERPVLGMAVSPSGDLWAATVGVDAAAEIVLGRLTPQGPQVAARASDGRSPCRLRFSRDGKAVITGNRDATVSVYRVHDEAERQPQPRDR